MQLKEVQSRLSDNLLQAQITHKKVADRNHIDFVGVASILRQHEMSIQRRLSTHQRLIRKGREKTTCIHVGSREKLYYSVQKKNDRLINATRVLGKLTYIRVPVVVSHRGANGYVSRRYTLQPAIVIVTSHGAFTITLLLPTYTDNRTEAVIQKQKCIMY